MNFRHIRDLQSCVNSIVDKFSENYSGDQRGPAPARDQRGTAPAPAPAPAYIRGKPPTAEADRQQIQIGSRGRLAADTDRQQRQIGSRYRSLDPVFQLSFFASSSGGFNGLEATNENPFSVSIPD